MATILSVMSGKGGTGKSTLSASLGQIAARQGNRVLLVDLDAGLGSLDLMLGLEDRMVFDLGDVLAGRCTPMDAAYPCPHLDKLSLASAPMAHGTPFSVADTAAIFAEYRRAFDLILLDLPAGITASVDAARSIADESIVVVTPDMIAVRDAQRLAELLPEKPARMLINKVSRPAMKAGGLADLDEAIDLAGLPLLGVVPFDASLAKLGHAPQTRAILSAIVSRIFGTYVPLILQSV